MVTTELCEEGGTFCFALQFGTGCICLVLFASVGSSPSVLSTCAILEPAVPRFRAQEQAAFPLTAPVTRGTVQKEGMLRSTELCSAKLSWVFLQAV